MSNKLQLHPKLTECKQCKSYNHSSTHHPTYKHCCVIQCSICGTHWYACIEHNKRFNIANQNKLHSHFVNEHSFPYIQHSMNSPNHSDTTNIEFTTFNADDEDDEDFDNSHTFKKLRSEQISNKQTIRQEKNKLPLTCSGCERELVDKIRNDASLTTGVIEV